MTQMILAAIAGTEQVYFVIDPKSSSEDGVVVNDSGVRRVPFWSYVTRTPVEPVKTSTFLEQLWDQNSPKSPEWSNVYLFRSQPIPEEVIKRIKPFLIDVPSGKQPKRISDDLEPISQKSLEADVSVKAKRVSLKDEPYDPDARDGDSDGIIQEGTAWERPAGARFLKETGEEIARGYRSAKRPKNGKLVDRDGNELDYTPTYERAETGTIGAERQIGETLKPERVVKPVKPEAPTEPEKPEKKPGSGTPLSDHGAPSIRERGLQSVRETTAPPPPPAPPKPEKKPKAKDLPLVEFSKMPGVNSASVDRPELEEPKKPRSPYKPSPPPLSGHAQELADEADGDFTGFVRRLDEEGYVVFDYETTGLQDGNIPIQIGAVRVKNGKIVERFNVFTNPERPLSQWSKDNLKDADGSPISDEWLSTQMDLAEAHRQLVAFIGDSVIVAHNFPYDGEILERMTREAGIDFTPAGTVDTLSLLRSLVPKGDGTNGPERHTLGSLADFYGVDLGDAAHTADADSEAAARVLQEAANRFMGSPNRYADSSRDVFDAEKQKKLFAEATKKYQEDMKKYEEELKQYESDLADYQRAIVKGVEPESPTDSPDYRMGHQPSDDGPRAHAITENGWLPPDVWDSPEFYSGADERVVEETMDQLKTVVADPNAMVTIYRWAPEGSEIEPGNWVSLSRTYAQQHGESNANGVPGSVISIQVPAKEVRFAGDDLAEWGWFPDKASVDPDLPNPEDVFDFYTPGADFDPDRAHRAAQRMRQFIELDVDYFLEEELGEGQLEEILATHPEGFTSKEELKRWMVDEIEANVRSGMDDLRASDLYYACTPDSLRQIIIDRRMKTQFETGTSGGLFSPNARREVESRQMGIGTDVPDTLRPSYGFQVHFDEWDVVTGSPAARHYGRIVLRLKDSVRNRTTMSAGDSLDNGLLVVPVDGPINNEDMYLAAIRENHSILEAASDAVKRGIKEDLLGDYWEGEYGDSAWHYYNEVQIHGGSTLADIEEVLFPVGLSNYTGLDELKKMLDTLGISWRDDY